MPDNDFPRINGHYNSWAEIGMQMQAYGGGAVFRPADFTAISFEENLEPGEVRGQGSGIRGTTEGEYTTDGSVTLTIGAHVLWMAELAKTAKTLKIKLGMVQFSFSVGWRRVVGEPLIRASLIGCRVKGRSFDGSPGADGSQMETPLHITRVRINGLSLGEVPK